jgi:hypothetical protein
MISHVDVRRCYFRSSLQGRTTLRGLSRIQDYSASEPRDYVYALLAFFDIPVATQQLFTVNYENSVHEVFVNATRGVIEATRSLDIMHFLPGTSYYGVSRSTYWNGGRTGHIRPDAYRVLNSTETHVGKHAHPKQLLLAGRCFGKIQELQILV